MIGPSVALAQDTGAIEGTIVDAANNQPVADVVVTASGPTEQTVVSEADGTYRISDLTPGTYTVRFEGPAHRPFSRSNVTVTAGVAVRFNVELAPEAITEELVVTGSRIPRIEVATAAPVAVVGRAQIESQGRANIGDILQQLPEQSNAINAQVNNGGDGSVRINLRGLGTGRTLVLLNGRRHVPAGTGANSTVDLNTIPPAAIQRIEILKDGASAVYGSDAIAGVVNIITRKDFSGTELSLFGGTSQRLDGTFWDLSLTTGHATQRGNVLFSGSFFNQEPIWAGDRDFSRIDLDYDFSTRTIGTLGSSATPRGFIIDRGEDPGGNEAWQQLRSTAGRFVTRARPGEESVAAGWRAFDFSGIDEAGGDFYNYQPANYLLTPSQRFHLFSIGTMKLGGAAEAYYEATFTNRQSAQKLAPEPLFTIGEGVRVSAQNVYNPFGRDFIDVRRRLSEFSNRTFSQDLDTFRLVTGMRNQTPIDLGFIRGVNWDLSVNYGRTQGVETKTGLLQLSRLQNAVGPSFIDPASGEAVCGTPSDPITDDGCVPLNLFGGAELDFNSNLVSGTITDEMMRYVSYTGTARGFNQQFSAQANTSAELMKIGNALNSVAFAAGYEFRREVGANIPDPLTNKGDTTGNKSEQTIGGYTVNEGYAELSLPIMGRLGGEQGDMVELTAATRVSNYSTYGTNATYKVGAKVSPIQDVILRGTYSTAFRAPSIAELFAGNADSFPLASDPCNADNRARDPVADARCAEEGIPAGFNDERAQLRSRVGGNTELRPETANVFTVGVVLQPRAVPNLVATVDYYNFTIRDAISSLGVVNILDACYSPEGGIDPAEYCRLIERDPATNLITNIDNRDINVGGNFASGIDFALRYDQQTAFGNIGLSADVSYLLDLRSIDVFNRATQGVGTYDLGIFPNLRANTGITWSTEPFNAGMNVRWVNGFRECATLCTVQEENAQQPAFRNVEPYYTVDLNFGYRLRADGGGTTSIQAGIQNLFDRDPVYLATGFTANSDPSAYDFVGRFGYLRLTHTFQ